MKRWATSGFTIIELLVVIVVIGIIATIVVVGYGAVQSNARDTAVKADLKNFSDTVNLKALDDQYIPAGGATDTSEGDLSLLEGIMVHPNAASYDTSVSNLYYCAGNNLGYREFALAAQSLSGKVFYYLSNHGVQEKADLTFGKDPDGPTVCAALGFDTPFTWSVGLDARDDSYGWSEWALPTTEEGGA